MGDSDFDGGLLKVALFLINKLFKSHLYVCTLPDAGLMLIKQHKQYSVEDR